MRRKLSIWIFCAIFLFGPKAVIAQEVPERVLFSSFNAVNGGRGDEWVEIWNNTNKTISLQELRIEDRSGVIVEESKMPTCLLPPSGKVQVRWESFKLNNDGDLLKLYFQTQMLDCVAYGKAEPCPGKDEVDLPDPGTNWYGVRQANGEWIATTQVPSARNDCLLPTPTPSPTLTPIPFLTPTSTSSPTPSPALTLTSTPKPTSTPTPTFSPTQTVSFTPTSGQQELFLADETNDFSTELPVLGADFSKNELAADEVFIPTVSDAVSQAEVKGVQIESDQERWNKKVLLGGSLTAAGLLLIALWAKINWPELKELLKFDQKRKNGSSF